MMKEGEGDKDEKGGPVCVSGGQCVCEINADSVV